jgi:RNA polymerase sigma factor (sigma-70 family)
LTKNEIEINRSVYLVQNSTGEERKKAMEQVYKKLKPFRFGLARRFANKGVEFDDIVQQIDLKILEAIIDYDDSKDASALRHLISKARNGIWNYYRKEMNYFDSDKKSISLDTAWIKNSGAKSTEGESYEFVIQHQEEFDEDKILDQIVIQEELDKLTPHQKEILFMYFIDDMTQYSIAEELSINQANVSRAKKRGVESIRLNINPSDGQSGNSLTEY